MKNKFNIRITSNNDPRWKLSIKNSIWHFNSDYINEGENWADDQNNRYYSRIIRDSLFGISYSVEYKLT